MKTTILSMLLAFAAFSSFAQDNDDDYTPRTKSTKMNNDRYGKNIIAFSPVHLISDDNVGVGMSYERLVNDYVGIRVPIMGAINQPYINIGIETKFYPTKNSNRPVKYAIAPSLMFGTGQRVDRYTDYVYNSTTGQYDYVTTSRTYDRAHFGFLLNQTINFTIMQNFYIGIDGGLGINYYDNRTNYYSSNINNYNNNRMSVAGQFHMMIGARF